MSGADRPGRWVGRALTGLVAGAAAYYGIWGGEYSALDLRHLGQRTEEVTGQLAASRQQVDSLRRVAARLDRDPAAIEAVARERFGMIRQGEILYRFVEVSPTTQQVARRQGPAKP